MKPQILECQPEDIEPIYFTHFDCWSDGGDESSERWEWDDSRSINLVHELARQWFTVLGDNILILANQYTELGQIKFFEQVAELFVAAGYCVYDSDNFFEVYVADELEKDLDCKYPIEDWKQEVADDNTMLGYQEWKEHMTESNRT